MRATSNETPTPYFLQNLARSLLCRIRTKIEVGQDVKNVHAKQIIENSSKDQDSLLVMMPNLNVHTTVLPRVVGKRQYSAGDYVLNAFDERYMTPFQERQRCEYGPKIVCKTATASRGGEVGNVRRK